MADGSWNEAYNEFYEGFRAYQKAGSSSYKHALSLLPRRYQEAGNSRAKDCLKYVVLANMLG
jgi:hypothetical protein